MAKSSGDREGNGRHQVGDWDRGPGPDAASHIAAARRFRGRVLVLAIATAVLLSGCSRLIVESKPSGAEILWSPNGLDPWRRWPPLNWTDPAQSADSPTTVTTPLKTSGLAGHYLFVTVRMPGYYPARPRLIGLRRWGTTRIAFDLVETPEHFAEIQRAKGLVPYRGEWVRPEDYALVEYEDEWMTQEERTQRENAAKGLLEFEGEWLTPEEYQAAYAKSQTEKGRVEFKNRWMTPALRDFEQKIDSAIEQILEVDPPEVLPPKVLGGTGIEMAGLALVNQSERPTRWLFSGPMSRWQDIAPGGQVSPEDFRLVPGRYTVAIFELDVAAVRPQGEDSQASKTPHPPVLPDAPLALQGLVVLVDQPVSDRFDYSLTYTPLTPRNKP